MQKFSKTVHAFVLWQTNDQNQPDQAYLNKINQQVSFTFLNEIVLSEN